MTEPTAAVLDEQALLQGLRERRPDAYETLVRTYTPRLLAVARRMLPTDEDARDAVQDAFLNAFRSIDRFEGQAKVSTWLHRLTVNQVLMHFRRRSVKNEKTTEEGEMPEQAVTGTANPAKMAVVDRIALKNAISQLPKGYRTVFVLHDVQGFEHEEVARIMGISVGTSKSQLHKARLKLRGLLLQENE